MDLIEASKDKGYIDTNDGICMYKPISYYKMIWIDNFNLIKSKLDEGGKAK